MELEFCFYLPFEMPLLAIAPCSLLHLFMKTALLMAITSAQRHRALGPSMTDPAFTVSFKEKILLWQHPRFLPKVSFELDTSFTFQFFFLKPQQMRQEICLLYFGCQEGVRCSSVQIEGFLNNSPRLSIANRSKGSTVSTQRLKIDLWMDYLVMILPIFSFLLEG